MLPLNACIFIIVHLSADSLYRLTVSDMAASLSRQWAKPLASLKQNQGGRAQRTLDAADARQRLATRAHHVVATELAPALHGAPYRARLFGETNPT
jgi:hypothetical protein